VHIPFFSPSLLSPLPIPFSSLLSGVTSSFWGDLTRRGEVVVVVVAGGGCTDEKLVTSAWLGPSCNNKLLLRGIAGVKTGLSVNAHPLVRDGGLKRLHVSSNTEKQTKFTKCEFKFEIQQRLSSLVDNPSQRRYFSSLWTRSTMRSTSSLASMHQWSKSPILTKDFTILCNLVLNEILGQSKFLCPGATHKI
jgi:hypothetical protein